MSVEVTLVVAKKLAFRKTKLKNAKARAAYRAKLSFVGGVAPLTS